MVQMIGTNFRYIRQKNLENRISTIVKRGLIVRAQETFTTCNEIKTEFDFSSKLLRLEVSSYMVLGRERSYAFVCFLDCTSDTGNISFMGKLFLAFACQISSAFINFLELLIVQNAILHTAITRT